MRRLAWSVAIVVLAGASGCKPGPTEPAQGSPTAAAAPTSAAKPVLHPCDLLGDATVAAVVVSAQPGQRDTADEGHGISACRWSAGENSVVLQVFEAGPGGLAHELRAASLEIVDLGRKDASSLVRLEPLAGIPDLAGVFVERADAPRGIRKSNAVLMVQRGSRLAVLRIPQIADGDRAQALQALKTLGSEIAKGL